MYALTHMLSEESDVVLWEEIGSQFIAELSTTDGGWVQLCQ